jgi:hypothetical protein
VASLPGIAAQTDNASGPSVSAGACPVPITLYGQTPGPLPANGKYVLLEHPLPLDEEAKITTVEASILTGGEGMLGFYFLRPYWARRDFAIGVSGPDGVILGDGRDVAHDYSAALVGRVGVHLPGSITVAFRGFNLNLDSHLNRTFASGSTMATLLASNTFNLTELTALETPLSFQPFPAVGANHANNKACEVTVGVQYLQLAQEYQATLAAGTNSTSRHAHQDFTGFGVTAAVTAQSPDWHGWRCYGNLRGVVVIGTNNRNGSFSSTGMSTVTATDTRTDFVPVGEVEVGIEWEPKPFAQVDTQARLKTTAESVLLFRLGFVGQVIGDAGLPTVTHDQRAFDNGAVFLAGFGAQLEYRP